MTRSISRHACALVLCVAALLTVGAGSASASYILLGNNWSDRPTGNVATGPFALNLGWVDLHYQCWGASSGTYLQITSNNQGLAYRRIPATCNGSAYRLDHVGGVPTGTALRARLHNYSGRTFRGGTWAYGYGWTL